MRFPSPLVRGTLQRRYKRFLADVVLEDGTELTAHCPNPGAMMGLDHPGETVWLSKSDNPKRKLSHTLEIVSPPEGGLVGINTNHPNTLVHEAIADGRIEVLKGYAEMKREVRYGTNSRIDILLADKGRPDAYVEVKNVHLMRETGRAEFPDSVTKRGAKHLGELALVAEAGKRAVMVYLVQRMDCESLSFARDLDPGYADAFADARERGVEALAFDCDITPEAIVVRRPIPVLEAG